jgi:hypothetical protein
MSKPTFHRAAHVAPVWRCGVLEIRDVKKDGGAYSRTGFDPSARYNLWVGQARYPSEISPTLADLKRWALETFDPETGERK